MSHLLIVELPGGSDADILAAALAGGHSFAFLTADAAHYLAQPELAALLAQGRVIEAPGFAAAEALVRAAHHAQPFDAVLCLQDLRLAEAAELAAGLGLPHLNPATAALCRDKAAVRQALAKAGLPQPISQRVRGTADLLATARAIGLPLIVKPVDGFGSQHVFALRTPADLALLDALADQVAEGPGTYGLGVAARGELLVERLLEGPVVGCDTMTAAGRHCLLGVNAKLFFAPPSFAIRGGCFSTNIGQFAVLEAYVGALLDAVGFDHGAAHIELALTADGPQLIELNPRLVGAGIGRLIGAARRHPVHEDLIALHVGQSLPAPATGLRHAVTRWITAPKPGMLEAITPPPVPPEAEIRLLACPGMPVAPPLDNADRLGCVMASGPERAALESLCDELVAATRLVIA